ncbi:UPF0481 protein At3g47200-like [Neltuma alba]|uniref:UPF0481 protein At3g47200-like n=1 Tax=Neltuma alba TaxID=207710 RepID=UPI0010A35A50|nr:UPF0481 protein At3g47200-like [Prosopis alba]
MEDEVMVDIKTMIGDSGYGYLSPDCCISRVIHTARDIKPDAYTPKFVSIGPFHYGNERLQEMERHKQAFLKRFTQRSSTELDVIINFVRSSVTKVRASYSENINLSDKELVKLILLDAAFIIEFLFIMHYKQEILIDAKLSQQPLIGILPLDLVLFENQLPFSILEELFNIAFPPNLRDDGITFLKLASWFFSATFHLEEPKHDLDNVSVKHFTDLLRFLLLQGAPPEEMEPLSYTTQVLSYSAKELQEFGVKLKASKSKSPLDIKFSGYVLELPQILAMVLVTEALFFNMIAFEQIHCPVTSYITGYAIVWSRLIATKEDVDVLVDNEIVRNYLVNTEVVELFGIMVRNAGILMLNSEYLDIFKRLNKFCENSLRRSKASLIRDYCRTPWQTVASFAGIILLILTILQTILSIFQHCIFANKLIPNIEAPVFLAHKTLVFRTLHKAQMLLRQWDGDGSR